MLGNELRFLSNGRQMSIEDLADLIASRVASLVTVEVKQHLAPPRITQANPKATVASVRDSTQLLGLSRSTLWKLIKEKRLETVRLGRRTLIRMESIERLLTEGIREDRPGRQNKQ
jgi:excisionase family DNA binding protein